MARDPRREPVEHRAVHRGRDVLGLHDAAARGRVDRVPAVVRRRRVVRRVPRDLDVHEEHRVVQVVARRVDQRPPGLLPAPGIALAGGPVVVRVHPRPGHEPVGAGAHARVGAEVGGGLLGVGRGPDQDLAAAVLPPGPVARHPDVAAVAPAEDRLAVGHRPRDGNGAAVGAVPEARWPVARGAGRRRGLVRGAGARDGRRGGQPGRRTAAAIASAPVIATLAERPERRRHRPSRRFTTSPASVWLPIPFAAGPGRLAARSHCAPAQPGYR